MKNNFLIFVWRACVTVLILSFGCSKEQDDKERGLAGTKWKLAALVDVQTHESIEPEPKECNQCYTFEFDSDTTAIGRSVLNELHLTVISSSIKIGMTKIWDGENNNVKLLYDAFETLDTYENSKDELKIYYDGKNKYLLYKSLLQ
jgi:hypothetical protein